jgi:hypothetical protein
MQHIKTTGWVCLLCKEAACSGFARLQATSVSFLADEMTILKCELTSLKGEFSNISLQKDGQNVRVE